MLSGKQKRYLRGLGHSLNPVVTVGKEGVSEPLERKTAVELEGHELIKVRVLDTCETPARDVGPALAERTASELVQVLGHTLLLYKRRKKDPTIKLPKADPVVLPAPSGG